MSLASAFDDKERVRQATDIVDLVGSYLQLRRQGANYVALCPWHDDHRPSLQINPARQSWKCWVCEVGGDVFSFVMKRENVDFREALRILAERSGIVLSHAPRTAPAGSAGDKSTLYQAISWAEEQFHQCLQAAPEGTDARQYLDKRGVDLECIRQFRVGYAPDSYCWLQDRARSANIPTTILAACGLITESEGGRWYERFRGRIIFPIFDTQNRPVGFGGRILPEISERRSQTGNPPAKYVNSPETPVFSKSSQLYGLNLARDVVGRRNHLVIVEGYTDVIAMHQAGIEHVAAILGTALNERHIRLIRHQTNRVTLILDGDDAGRRRASEVLELFLRGNIDLRILTLPDGMDPADFVRQRGAEAMELLIEKAPDALDHKIRLETSGLDLISDTQQTHRALENILKTIASLPSSVLSSSSHRIKQQQLINRLSRQFRLEPEQLRTRLRDMRKSLSKLDNVEELAENSPLQVDRKETALIELLLFDSGLVGEAMENISPGYFVEGPCKEIYEAIRLCYQQGQPPDYQHLMVQLELPRAKHLLVELDEVAQAKNEKSEVDSRSQLETLICAFEQTHLDSASQQGLRKLTHDQLDDQEEASILEELFERARQRQGVSAPTDG